MKQCKSNRLKIYFRKIKSNTRSRLDSFFESVYPKVTSSSYFKFFFKFRNYLQEGMSFIGKFWPDNVNQVLVPLIFLQSQFDIKFSTRILILCGVLVFILILSSGIFYKKSGLLELEQRAQISHNPMTKEQFDRLKNIEIDIKFIKELIIKDNRGIKNRINKAGTKTRKTKK